MRSDCHVSHVSGQNASDQTAEVTLNDGLVSESPQSLLLDVKYFPVFTGMKL